MKTFALLGNDEGYLITMEHLFLWQYTSPIKLLKNYFYLVCEYEIL